jgi:hypothetical protein
MTPLEAKVTEEARSFEDLSLDQLRAAWRARYGAPPKLRSPDLLRRLLAWRVQAEVLGGLEAALVRQIIGAAKAGKTQAPAAPAGTRISREWQGKIHEVEVVTGGFSYEGRRYKSLSAIARDITGARWNGPRFFGLREAA